MCATKCNLCTVSRIVCTINYESAALRIMSCIVSDGLRTINYDLCGTKCEVELETLMCGV